MVQILDVNAKKKAKNIAIKRNDKREIVIDKSKKQFTITSGDIKIFIDLKNNIRNYQDSEIGEIQIDGPKLIDINDAIHYSSGLRTWQELEEKILIKCLNINHNIPRRYISILLNRSMRAVSTKARNENIYARNSKYDKNKASNK